MRTLRFSVFTLLLIMLLIPTSVKMQQKTAPVPTSPRTKNLAIATERAAKAAEILRELMSKRDTRIPKYIMTAAEVLAVFSSRPAFGLNKEDGVGLVTARNPQTREWLAPIYISFKGGHIEGRLGDSNLNSLFDTRQGELIILGMNKRTVPYFFNPEFELGSDALVLSGSFGKGRPGDDIPAISSGFIGYYHSQGRMIGVSVAGSVIRQDEDLNDAVYEERRLSSFLAPQNFMSPQVLAFPTTLNELTRR